MNCLSLKYNSNNTGSKTQLFHWQLVGVSASQFCFMKVWECVSVIYVDVYVGVWQFVWVRIMCVNVIYVVIILLFIILLLCSFTITLSTISIYVYISKFVCQPFFATHTTILYFFPCICVCVCVQILLYLC